MFSKCQSESIDTIQKYFRSHLTQKKYSIQELKPEQQTDYSTFIVGNDPTMSELDQFTSDNSEEKIGLVSTGGARSISLACKLGNSQHTPKNVIVDNSRLVYKFWLKLKDFTYKQDTEEKFLLALPQFLSQNESLYRSFPDDILKKGGPYNTLSIDYLNQNPCNFFKSLFKKYGYDYVTAVIKHTSVICQSWTDKQLFMPLTQNLWVISGSRSSYY